MSPEDQDRVSAAIANATLAHAIQVDKAGEPYILHPLRVMLQFRDPVKMQAAVLHDIVEDTDYTLETLGRYGFSWQVIQLVDALTKRDSEKYKDYLARVCELPAATEIKIEDIRDNMSRLHNLPEKEAIGLRKRYEYALGVLAAALAGRGDLA